jgi:hypothetical protein
VRCKEHTAQLGEANRRIIEHSEDRLAIGNRECDEILLGVQRDKKHIACVLEACREQQPSQVGNVLFVDRNTGEPHASDATRRCGATNEAATHRWGAITEAAFWGR